MRAGHVMDSESESDSGVRESGSGWRGGNEADRQLQNLGEMRLSSSPATDGV